jgi:hypothetical protein
MSYKNFLKSDFGGLGTFFKRISIHSRYLLPSFLPSFLLGKRNLCLLQLLLLLTKDDRQKPWLRA